MSIMSFEAVVALLMIAKRDGSEVFIEYHGGSTPGAIRSIFPLRIEGGKVYAREVASGRGKTYAISKISMMAFKDGLVVEAGEGRSSADLGLDGYAEKLSPDYSARGWHVFHDPRRHVFGVGRFFKNGQPRKTLAFQIQFSGEPESVDPETGEVLSGPFVHSSGERPWRVICESWEQSRSFGKLERAMSELCAAIDAASPTQLQAGRNSVCEGSVRNSVCEG